MSRISNAYLTTRLRLFSSRLLSFDDLSHLLKLDLAQVLLKVAKLTGQNYQLNEDNPVSVDNQLERAALNDFQILIRPFSGADRQFFYYAIRWFELVNLKLLIRGKFTRTNTSIIRQQLVDLGVFADLPLNQLLESEDPHEMLRLLESTAYAAIVRQARYVYEKHGNDLFLLDATIDKSFFINLKQRLKALNPRDSKQVTRVMAVLLDRFNLLWLLRYRFSYGLSPAKSYYLLTAIGNKLHAADLMQLAKMQSLEEILTVLPQPMRTQLAGLKTITEIETVLEYSTLAVAATELKRLDNVVSGYFAYILLREAETRFLQALFKGKQLRFDASLIQLAVLGDTNAF